MDRLICGICMEELGNKRDVCSLPCGHVKHIDCLTEWSKEKKKCPNCDQRFNSSEALRKRLYFDKDDAPGANNEAVQDDAVLAINEVLKQQLQESKAEVDAAQTRVNGLEESIRKLEQKLQDSEVQLQKSSENNQSLINGLNKLVGKIRETVKKNRSLEQEHVKNKAEVDSAKTRVNNLEESIRELERKHKNAEIQLQQSFERNRNLQQELNNSQAKIRDLEAEFDQTHVGQLIKRLTKETENLKNCEVSRLQNSLETKGNEIEYLNDLLDTKDNKIDYLLDSLNTKEYKIQYLNDSIYDKDKEIYGLNLSLKNQNYELSKERKLRLGITERLKKKDEEATNLSKENTNVKRDLYDMQKRLIRRGFASSAKLVAAEKQNADTKMEKEKMKEQLAEWQHYHREMNKLAKYGDKIGDEIGNRKKEPTNSQSLQQQNPPRIIVPIIPSAASKRQNSGSANGDPAKRARIDTQEKSEEDGAKKVANVASGSKAVINS